MAAEGDGTKNKTDKQRGGLPNGSSGIDEHAWVVQAFNIDGSSDEEISLGVFTFRNGEYTSQYMAIANSYNYNMDDTLVANVILSSETQNYDNGAFRLRYVPAEHAYRIAPICSGNGYYRVVSRGIGSVDMGINEIRGSNSNYQLFDILRFSDGSIGFQMKGTTEVLSVENGEVVLRDYTENNLKQHWFASVYTYKDSGMTYASVDEYYHSLNFGSPFGANGRSLVMTSGYGPRNTNNGSSTHKGLDLRTVMEDNSEDHMRNLYSPLCGTVVAINTSLQNSAGRYVVVKVNGDSLEEDQSIYVVYMHLSSVNVKSSSNPTGIYANMLIDTTTLIGISGRSGVEEASYPAHLHVGVFLAPENQSTFSSAEWNSNALNPLLFYTPDDYDVKP